jgi:DTW domain-containing protein YfiP
MLAAGARVKPRGFRQARCAGCGLTDESCVCGQHERLDCPVSISVVMSRPEARSASNSARLLALWLPGVELHVRGAGGEEPAPETLVARAGAALLFPGAGRPEPLPAGVRHLIVPDGTWSQARRIERRWFAAHGLPRVALCGPWPSMYGLRRAPEGLCTFEAVALALGLLHDRALAERLLERFAEWARRAQRLKAGGAPAARAQAPGIPAAHPAIGLLRALPAGSSDAAEAAHSAALTTLPPRSSSGALE